MYLKKTTYDKFKSMLGTFVDKWEKQTQGYIDYAFKEMKDNPQKAKEIRSTLSSWMKTLK